MSNVATVPTQTRIISNDTPMGANLVANGAIFRVWAPGAEKVYVIGDFNAWAPNDPGLLETRPGGHWPGFLPEVKDGAFYKFWFRGTGTSGPKRDPYARDLEDAWPNPKCVVRSIVIRDARVRAANGRPEDAARNRNVVHAEAVRSGFVSQQLEARLAEAEIEKMSNKPARRTSQSLKKKQPPKDSF